MIGALAVAWEVSKRVSIDPLWHRSILSWPREDCARRIVQEVVKIEDIFGPQRVEELLRECLIEAIRWRGSVSGKAGIIHGIMWVILSRGRQEAGWLGCGR